MIFSRLFAVADAFVSSTQILDILIKQIALLVNLLASLSDSFAVNDKIFILTKSHLYWPEMFAFGHVKISVEETKASATAV